MAAIHKFAAAHHLLEQAVASAAFPGAAYGVLHHDELTSASVGRFTYEEDSPAVHPGTIYDIASVTKVVATTAMAMRLFERGLLALDCPVCEIIPEFLAGESANQKRVITLRMLLAHSSGLSAWAPLYKICSDRESLLHACFTMPLAHRPMTVVEYSDIGFIILGEALARLAFESLDAFVSREIYPPLAMSSTLFRPPATIKDQIPPSEPDLAFRKKIIQGEVQDENCWVMGGVSGHAGLFSNVPDLLQFSQCMLGGTRELFWPETIEFFTTRESEPHGSSRALGWDTPSPSDSSSGHFFSPHSAGHLGYSGASLWIDFERRISIALLTNRCWPSRDNVSIRSVRPAFHDAVMSALL